MNAQNNDLEATETNDVAYEDMSWQKLKALMTAESQEWVNAEHAIAYLNALDKADDENSGDADPEAETEQTTGDAETTDETDSDAEADPEAENKESGEVAGTDGTDESTDDVGDDSDPDLDDDIIEGDDLISEPADETEPCFDPDAPYGEVCGSSKARYWQNGMHFDGQGKYVPDEDGY